MRNVERVYREIGKMLSEFRQKNALTQENAAELLGLERTSITNIELGRQRIMLHTIIGIAAMMGTTPGKLVDKAIRHAVH